MADFFPTTMSRRQRLIAVVLAAAAAVALGGCADLKSYRPELPPPAGALDCDAVENGDACQRAATERHRNYTLHVTEFDDQGWLFGKSSGRAADQIDSALDQITATLKGSDDCVRVIVFVHGWHHTAAHDDSNMKSFRDFLDQLGSSAFGKAREGGDACDDADTARARAAPSGRAAEAAPAPPKPFRQARIVGIYVGWRGDSFAPRTWLDTLSFWDRKSTAERVAQGSVRELFGRLNVLARPLGAKPAPGEAAAGKPERRLRTYVIGHSFGASVAFRALSQTVLNGFADGIGSVDGYANRYIDMVVLVNPAIEASRFDPIYRTARKHQAYCERGREAAAASGDPAVCDRTPYQAPLLSIFTAQNDRATGRLFPIGAGLDNFFQSVVDPAELDAMNQTIGWNDAYKTHTIALDPAACRSAGPAGRDPSVPGPDGRPIYAPAGWRWCFGEMLLQHLGAEPQVAGAEPPYNGPLWNVRVTSRDIVDRHNGIWDDDFRGVILQLFKDEMLNGFRETP